MRPFTATRSRRCEPLAKEFLIKVAPLTLQTLELGTPCAPMSADTVGSINAMAACPQLNDLSIPGAEIGSPAFVQWSR